MSTYTTNQPRTAWQVATKVPKMTIYFWIVKILTTAMGEATSDFLALKFGPIPAVTIGASALALALIWQFKMPHYKAWPYWTTVAMVSVFGTMAADGLHVEVGVPYIYSTTFYLLCLIGVLTVWYLSEHTLSIHSIHTRRREVFYWLTVMATFALGTALGDLTATTFGLGYFTAGLMFMGLFAIPGILFWKFKLNAIAAFWFAYIMTRPLGASFADWGGVPHSLGGLGLGRATVSLSLSVVIIALVAYLAITKKDAQSTL